MTRSALLTIRIGPTALIAEARRGSATVWAGEATYASPAELEELIGRLAADCGVLCRRLRVAVERPPVQLRTLTDLPPVRESELAALVAHQAGRFFRRNGAPLVTDAVWTTAAGARVARAAAVDESLVEGIAAGARAAGLVLDTVTVANADLPLALLPGTERASRARAARQRARVLAAVAAGVWVAVAAWVVVRLVWERHSLDRELRALEAPLAAVVAARRALNDGDAAVTAIAGVERARGDALALLARVAHALPDSAVLTSLTWRGDGPVILTGAARQATDVLARLERTPGVTAPAFEGPVVRERVAGRVWDRFTIVFKATADEGDERMR